MPLSRVVRLLLLVFLLVLQYRLWVGEGSLARVAELKQRIASQQEELSRRRARNAALRADVADLREGREAVEERARSELGMIREGETFIQVIDTSTE